MAQGAVMALLMVLWETRSLRATWRWLIACADEQNEIREQR
ncbi:hypothetical protein SEA_TDANISKY_42 [Mycobacterium phage TDanisky]|nr:hypothetical protein SEA_TDANISKY_42 [Mycobacterium phage TDanisky]